MRNVLSFWGLSKPKKLLFDHLPKCGGSTLKAYLQAHYPPEKTFLLDNSNPFLSLEKFKQKSQAERYNYDLIQGHLAHRLRNDVSPDCLKITLLREPVDRIISHYYFAQQTPSHYLYETITKQKMTLEEYATSNLSEELRNWYTTHFSGLPLSEAEEKPDQSVNQAVETLLSQYDMIGLLDNLAFFIQKLRRKVGLKYVYKNEKVNKTLNRPSLIEIPISTLQKIEEVNYLDLSLYSTIKQIIDY